MNKWSDLHAVCMSLSSEILATVIPDPESEETVLISHFDAMGEEKISTYFWNKESNKWEMLSSVRLIDMAQDLEGDGLPLDSLLGRSTKNEAN